MDIARAMPFRFQQNAFKSGGQHVFVLRRHGLGYPERYAFIWIVFTLLSPFLAFGTWFSKEKGVVPIVISAFILALLINTAFNYGLYYIAVTNLLNALIFVTAAVILKRNASETSIMLALALILAIIMRFALPYQIW